MIVDELISLIGFLSLCKKASSLKDGILLIFSSNSTTCSHSNLFFLTSIHSLSEWNGQKVQADRGGI